MKIQNKNHVAELSWFCYSYLVKPFARALPSLVRRKSSIILLWVSSLTVSCCTILRSTICAAAFNSFTAFIASWNFPSWPTTSHRVEVSPCFNLTREQILNFIISRIAPLDLHPLYQTHFDTFLKTCLLQKSVARNMSGLGRKKYLAVLGELNRATLLTKSVPIYQSSYRFVV